MKSIIKYPMLFLFGGSIYYLLEIIFRGYSFPAMVVCGGLCFVICGAINEKNRCMPLVLQQLIASAGLQQHAGKHSRSDMPSVHSVMVFPVGIRNFPG